MEQDRCLYCQRTYEPYTPMAGRQKVCGDPECQRKHKRAMDKAWYIANPDSWEARVDKKRAWARETRYYVQWRKGNKEYVERNREMTRERMRRRRQLAKEARGVLKEPVKHLEGLLGLGEGMFARQELWTQNPDDGEGGLGRLFARQEMLNRKVDGALGYLRCQAMFARPELSNS